MIIIYLVRWKDQSANNILKAMLRRNLSCANGYTTAMKFLQNRHLKASQEMVKMCKLRRLPRKTTINCNPVIVYYISLSENPGLYLNHLVYQNSRIEPVKVCNNSPVSTSYRRAVRSQDAVITCSPLGNQSAAITTFEWPAKERRGVRRVDEIPSRPSSSSFNSLCSSSEEVDFC